MKPHHGTLILTLGILGIVVCGPLGMVAWLMAAADLKEMDAGIMDPSGRHLTFAGKICGLIGTILFTFVVVMLCLAVAPVIDAIKSMWPNN